MSKNNNNNISRLEKKVDLLIEMIEKMEHRYQERYDDVDSQIAKQSTTIVAIKKRMNLAIAGCVVFDVGISAVLLWMLFGG